MSNKNTEPQDIEPPKGQEPGASYNPWVGFWQEAARLPALVEQRRAEAAKATGDTDKTANPTDEPPAQP